MRRRLIPALTLAALALPAAAAHAVWTPAAVLDGPNTDVVEVSDLDVSREGTGMLGWRKREAGVPHAFVSAFSYGTFAGAARADAGLPGPTTELAVAANNFGRKAVAFVNSGTLYTAVIPRRGRALTAPRPLTSGAISNVELDMSINGVSYVTFAQNGDLRAARAEIDSDAFTLIGTPLDIDPGRIAGQGDGRARVEVSADGSADVVWGERGGDGRRHIHWRRLVDYRFSSQPPQDLTLDGGGDAARPELDNEDDSSFAQVVFRQDTPGGPRVVSRRKRGTEFDPPEFIDNGGGTEGTVDLNGRGEGIYGVQGTSNQVFGTPLWNNLLRGTRLFSTGSNGVFAQPQAAIGDVEDGGVVWHQGTSAADATTRGRFLEEVEKPKLLAEATLNNPDWGRTDTTAGMEADANRSGDIVAAFVQDAGGQRRLVVSYYDQPPSPPIGHNGPGPKPLKRFKWKESRELLGRVRYQNEVDGRPVGPATTRTVLRVKRGQVRNGTHRWRVVAIDRAGNRTPSKTRTIRVRNRRSR
jgi:hypothetical protein